jgi:hypothetical protein
VIRLGLKEMVKFCEEFFPGQLKYHNFWKKSY